LAGEYPFEIRTALLPYIQTAKLFFDIQAFRSILTQFFCRIVAIMRPKITKTTGLPKSPAGTANFLVGRRFRRYPQPSGAAPPPATLAAKYNP